VGLSQSDYPLKLQETTWENTGEILYGRINIGIGRWELTDGEFEEES
jgi:hypothetical protein